MAFSIDRAIGTVGSRLQMSGTHVSDCHRMTIDRICDHMRKKEGTSPRVSFSNVFPAVIGETERNQ